MTVTKTTFRAFINELLANPAQDLAAQYLEVDKSKLKTVSDPEVEEKVLATGRSIKTVQHKMAGGTLVIVVYKMGDQRFVRAEYPDGEKKLFTV